LKILFAASEDAWGGFLNRIKKLLPDHEFIAEGCFEIKDLSGIDILIPTMSKVTDEILKKSDKLRLIQQCGAGLELVDINAARERGIYVANVPTDISGNADSVAEIAIYLMIGLSRNVELMKENLKKRVIGGPMGIALKGRTVGIVGLGGIGKALINRLRPFGVNLIGIKQSNPRQAQKELGIDWVGSPDDLKILLKQSDYVVLCLPLNDSSYGMINENTLKFMKQHSFLINVSRGGLVEYKALKSALKEKIIAGAGLDVFWDEPPDPADDIFQYNIMATPHIGGATDVSMQGIALSVAENINRLANGKIPINQPVMKK
jgi:phosphoglycerate dehydrogenase-like enzyme